MEQKDRDKAKNDIALFRYGLISPIVNNTPKKIIIERLLLKSIL